MKRKRFTILYNNDNAVTLSPNTTPSWHFLIPTSRLDFLRNHVQQIATWTNCMFNFSFNLSTKIFHIQSCNKYILTIFGTIPSTKNTANIRALKLFFSQFSSVAQSCPTLCYPMDCSTTGFPVDHQLPEIAQTRPLSQRCHLSISSSVVTFFSPLQSFPASGSFPVSHFFASDGQSIGVWASTSILPVNIWQHWFPLGFTGLISLLSKGLSRVFSNTTVQKHQFFSTQLSLWSNSQIHTWLMEKPQLWRDRPLLAK